MAAASTRLIGYGPGRFQLAEDRFVDGSLLLLPDGPHDWAATDVTALQVEDFDALIAQKDRIDVLFIGCGSAMMPLPKPVRLALEDAGLGYELMETGAACRAFNVLLDEGRRVAAALIALPK